MQGFSVFKKVSLYGLAGLGVFLLTCLLLNQWRDNPLKHPIQSILGTECTSENADAVEEDDLSKETERFVDIDGRTVRDEMSGYQYPNGTYNMSARNIGDFVMGENGKPIRSIILTTWRSGSTFLSEIIGSDPGNFLHHEPLLDFGMVVVRGPPLAEKALERIRKLFNCEYEDLQDYLEYARGHPFNSRRISETVRKRCIANSSMCYNSRYLTAMCKLSPFYSMKLIRLRLHVAQELLADEKLAVRIALLVRDPRGTVQSRKKATFCVEGPDCEEPALLCADLSANYKTAVELKNKYPNTFTVIRYEDLATDVYKQVERILKFYGRDYHPKVKEFLDTHTTTNRGDLFSTQRDSKTTPFHWRNELDFKEVEEIQRECATAMRYWGYVPAMNATHLREFHPVTNYGLNSL